MMLSEQRSTRNEMVDGEESGDCLLCFALRCLLLRRDVFPWGEGGTAMVVNALCDGL